MRAEVVKDYKPILSQCFSTDDDLLNKWHIVAGKGQAACVEKTFLDLQDAKVKFFKILHDESLAGYFCKEIFGDKQYLTGFFLMPEFRNEAMRLRFWAIIEMNFKLPFYCGLYEKNVPANKFIQSQGGKLIKRVAIPDGKAVLYKVGV
jgi:hypothetical protein